jgi:hypothetical protein
MKTLLMLISFILILSANAEIKIKSALPVAKAGSNQTIYLTQTSSVTLNGSASSGDSYKWTKITDVAPPQAGFPADPATIVAPTSATTLLTGLIQGVWYYQLAVTSGGVTALDSVVIRVDYDVPPPGGILVANVPIQDENWVKFANDRSDTTNDIGYTGMNKYKNPVNDTWLYFERARSNQAMIDSSRGKLYSTLEDGYNRVGEAFDRTQVTPIGNFYLDSNKTYLLELKFYFPQGIRANMMQGNSGSGWYSFAIFGIHASDALTGTGELFVMRDSICWNDNYVPTIKRLMSVEPADAGQAHTLRVTIREGKGYPGQKAFVKVQLDGVTKFYRDTGDVGRTWQKDYLKMTGLYDYGSRLVSPDSLARGRKFSMVTEAMNVYVLPENKVPTANAGTNQVMTLPQNSVALSGSGSDTDGTITSYQWTKMSGPSAYKIVSPNSANTEISGLVQGIYQFKLTVTDNSGSTGSAIVSVTVNAANISPVANAGTNKIITLPTSSISLSGSGSDADGTIKSYLWSKVSGPLVYNIVNPGLATTDVSGLVEGVYQFKLTVTDNEGAVGSAIIQVTVNAPANLAPSVTVGANKSIMLPTNTTSLAGSGSDPDGTIASYQWTKLSGPSIYNIVNPTSPVTDVSGLVQGVYQFQLSVKDNKGATGSAVIQINVNAAANIPPTASAGTNKNITLPISSVSLSGSGNDLDGTIVSYQWTKISGPSTFNITNPNSTSTDISNLVEGIYQFQLTVKDNKGDEGSSIVQVAVNKSISSPSIPGKGIVAYAGNDTTLIFPDNEVVLTGKGTDADGTIQSWSWSQISGPSEGTISSKNQAIAQISNLVEGTYEFELAIKDDKGLVGKDSISITVALARLARESNSLRVYPNPLSNDVTLEINTGENNSNLAILITDMLGKIVYNKEFISPDSNVKEKINLTDLAKGTYVMSVIVDGSRTQSVKVVKL